MRAQISEGRIPSISQSWPRLGRRVDNNAIYIQLQHQASWVSLDTSLHVDERRLPEYSRKIEILPAGTVVEITQ